MAIDNFWKSLRVEERQIVVGKDHLGNVYYEIDRGMLLVSTAVFSLQHALSL